MPTTEQETLEKLQQTIPHVVPTLLTRYRDAIWPRFRVWKRNLGASIRDGPNTKNWKVRIQVNILRVLSRDVCSAIGVNPYTIKGKKIYQKIKIPLRAQISQYLLSTPSARQQFSHLTKSFYVPKPFRQPKKTITAKKARVTK